MRTDVGALASLVRAHGFKNTRRALVFLASVAVFMHKTGDEPTIEALSAYWNQSERTTYRELGAWRIVSGDRPIEEAGQRVIEAYRSELLSQERPDVLALDVAQFVAG